MWVETVRRTGCANCRTKASSTPKNPGGGGSGHGGWAARSGPGAFTVTAEENANVVEFRILGPLEVLDGGRVVEVGGPKQRAVLAALVIDVGKVVSLDRLIDELWGDQPPARATGTLQAYISNLRRG